VGDSERTVTKWLMRCSDGLVASLYCIFDSDLDAAVMLGTRLPLEIFYPLCEDRTMTTNRKADMQSKIKYWLKTAPTRDRVSR
jgi:hypothetical protein